MKTSFESVASDTVERHLEDTLDMISEMDGRRIKLEDFHGVKFIEEQQIHDDQIVVDKLEAKFNKDPQRMSQEELRQFEIGNAAEYTFVHALEEAQWLAPKVNAIVTSKYDDYVRGIDTVAQIDLGEGRFEHLGFAIDFGTSKDDIGKKLLKTLDSIDRGSCPSVRYFNSPKTGKLKEFKLPRVIVGAGQESLNRLVDYSKEILNKTGVSQEASESLKTDPFKYVMLGEILSQLDFCIHRLEKVVEQYKGGIDMHKLQRAEKALEIHRNALSSLNDIMSSMGVTLEDIQKHVKGDSYAIEMAGAISKLSPLPIGFGIQEKKRG